MTSRPLSPRRKHSITTIHPLVTKITLTMVAAGATFAAAIMVAGYLIFACATPPNPSPPRKERTMKDRVSFFVGSFATIVRSIIIVHTTYHALLAILPSYAPARMLQLCPHAQNCNADLFTWSQTTVISLLLIYLGAAVRLSAYGGLGRSFTFHLAAPDQLVTTGVYHWIQHPSYSGLVLIECGFGGIFFRWDAVGACWLSSESLIRLSGWGPTVIPGAFIIAAIILTTRVRDEEEMLKKQFGRQWEEWHARTARYIPYLI